MDKYNYFPFVGQEMVEKNRERMSDQLKSDLESYMDYNQKMIRSSKPGDFGTYDTKSQISKGASEAYARQQVRTVKNLFDSAYLKPEDNYRVI